MGVGDFFKQVLSIVNFDDFKKNEFKPFKKEIELKVNKIEEYFNKHNIREELLKRKKVKLGINTEFELIEFVFQRMIQKYEQFHHNERDFSKFMAIQIGSVNKYYEDREEYRLDKGVSASMSNFVDQAMRKPIKHIKTVCTPEIQKIFITYDGDDRKDVIISHICKYSEIMKSKFEGEILGNKKILEDFI